MTALDLVVFDMAGTTVVDDGQVRGAFEAALRTHGVDVTPNQIDGVRGSSKREAVQQFFPRTPAGAERAAQVYPRSRRNSPEDIRKKVFAPSRGRKTRSLRYGARESESRWRLASNRPTTELLVNALGWTDHLVHAVVCGDDVPAGRPAPYLIFRAMEAAGAQRVQAVASVGDTALDLQAGCQRGRSDGISVCCRALTAATGSRRLRTRTSSHR